MSYIVSNFSSSFSISAVACCYSDRDKKNTHRDLDGHLLVDTVLEVEVNAIDTYFSSNHPQSSPPSRISDAWTSSAPFGKSQAASHAYAQGLRNQEKTEG